MDGDGGWIGSRNLFLHEMAFGVCILQSPFPHLAPWCSFSFHTIYLSLGPGGRGSPFSWADYLPEPGSWLSHKLKGQGSW